MPENTLTIRRPDDFHVHLRGDDLLHAVAPFTAGHFARALVMPNVPEILTAEDVVRYRSEINEAVGTANFEPLMTIKVTPNTTPAMIRAAYEAGAVAGKIYPAGVTTGADRGGMTVESLPDMAPTFRTMQNLGMVLCWHAELPRAARFVDAEIEMMSYIRDVVEAFPRLRQVVEHVTDSRTVGWVREAPPRVAATITVHHLYLTADDLVGRGEMGTGGKLHPHYFCAPLAKWEEDRHALISAATSGSPKFFLGTDSAPHWRHTKEAPTCCAGVFTAPVALSALAAVFEGRGRLDRLEAFVAGHGAASYGLPLNEGTITLERRAWTVSESYGEGPTQLVPFLAGRELAWRVTSTPA